MEKQEAGREMVAVEKRELHEFYQVIRDALGVLSGGLPGKDKNAVCDRLLKACRLYNMKYRL
jgi:hypothetical protein